MVLPSVRPVMLLRGMTVVQVAVAVEYVPIRTDPKSIGLQLIGTETGAPNP